MYLMQIVAAHSGRCGAPEREVVRTMMKNGASEAVAQLDIDQAVRSGALIRTTCRCQ